MAPVAGCWPNPPRGMKLTKSATVASVAERPEEGSCITHHDPNAGARAPSRRRRSCCWRSACSPEARRLQTPRAMSSATSWRSAPMTRPTRSSSHASTPRACRRRTTPCTTSNRTRGDGRSRATGTRTRRSTSRTLSSPSMPTVSGMSTPSTWSSRTRRSPAATSATPASRSGRCCAAPSTGLKTRGTRRAGSRAISRTRP